MLRLRTETLLIGLLTLGGCSPIAVQPGAERVRIVTNEPTGCQYLGDVTGSQGDFFTGWLDQQCEPGNRRSQRPEKPGRPVGWQHHTAADHPRGPNRQHGHFPRLGWRQQRPNQCHLRGHRLPLPMSRSGPKPLNGDGREKAATSARASAQTQGMPRTF